MGGLCDCFPITPLTHSTNPLTETAIHKRVRGARVFGIGAARVSVVHTPSAYCVAQPPIYSCDRRNEFEQEVDDYFRSAQLKHEETVVTGIDQAVGAFMGLFAGQNIDKMVVKLAS